jgi:hypothetical protein
LIDIDRLSVLSPIEIGYKVGVLSDGSVVTLPIGTSSPATDKPINELFKPLILCNRSWQIDEIEEDHLPSGIATRDHTKAFHPFGK